MQDKKKIQAVLFATGDKIEVEEISKLTKLDTETVKKLLKELQQDYKKAETPFMIIDEANKWKLTVREEYMPIVQKIVPHTELSKTIMETLAVIAWKAPVLQSDIIKIRTNKAYDHIKELVEMGFVTKQKHGRSYMIRLAQKFFDYFDLKGKKDVKEKFKEFRDVSEADVILEEIEERGIEPYGEEKLGELEVVDEPDEELGEEKLGKLDVFEEPKKKPHVEVYEEEKKPKLEAYDKPVGKVEPEATQQEPVESKEETPEEPERQQEKEQEKEEKLKKKIEEIEKAKKEISEKMNKADE